jgi:hypothetical protein
VVFLLSSTRLYMWWGGASAPARFLVPVVPLLAPAIALAVARLTRDLGRALVVATVVTSLSIAIVAVAAPKETLLYSDPHGVAALARAVQGSAPLTASWPTFTEENWTAPLPLFAQWLVALALAAIVTMVARRTGVVRTSFWIGATAIGAFALGGGVITGLRAPASRTAIADHGRIALMQEFDPTRLHAIDVTHVRRLGDVDVWRVVTLVTPLGTDDGQRNSWRIDAPVDLPEGQFTARLWFHGAVVPDATVRVRLSDQIVLAETAAAGVDPAVVRFDMAVGAPVVVETSGVTPRLVEIAPLSIVPRSLRAAPMAQRVEPIGGSARGFIAYTDELTYPEGGVFWTRDTEQGTIAVVTAGASTLRLLVHVGPNRGPVRVEAGGRRFDLDLAADETREIDIPIAPGVAVVPVSVRASRSFVPADVDPKSDDRRALGCQVRPQLY